MAQKHLLLFFTSSYMHKTFAARHIQNQFRWTVIKTEGQVVFDVLVCKCTFCRCTCKFILTFSVLRNEVILVLEWLLCVSWSEDNH
jgi:hypothetical protein